MKQNLQPNFEMEHSRFSFYFPLNLKYLKA